ncbi:MAG TPA: zinc ABC transporter substrate-binding protein [Usitatibacter sp.]|jgi:zinc/manganese transport system substrate-binding protein|nr:zinc ABC transporter substrate-binding protein [Usitatibacter sp.]
MKSIVRIAAALSCAAAIVPAHAALTVFATLPEWGALVQEIGGDKVKVYTATNALQDPHHVEARPSLIARARTAELVVATGAELEVGWLPLVLQQSGNSRVQPGTDGYFEAASAVPLLGRPTRLDRAEGDVHAQGDPHIQTDPRNIARVAAALVERMAQLDTADAGTFRANYRQFAQKWNAAVARWTQEAAPLKGAAVVVQHKGFTYLEAWLGLKEVAALEPKPGMEPTTSHLADVLETLKRQPAKMILRAAYLSDRPSQWLSERAHIPVVTLPFTVGGDDAAKDLFGLFDDTVQRLLKAQS